MEVTDYTVFTHIDTPKEQRQSLMVGDIYMNVAEHDVPGCGWIIRSRNVHDFVTCKCGKLSIDGGSWYHNLVGDIENAKSHVVYYNDRNNE